MDLRRVEPELLDELPASDPRAIRSRRDLRRVNAWMGNVRIMRNLLLLGWRGRSPRSMLDLGGGDGTFLLRLANRLDGHWPGLQVTLVDRRATVGARTHEALKTLGWGLDVVEADASNALRRLDVGRGSVAIANLFLHHLDEPSLMRLFERVSALTDLFVALDPRRSWLSHCGSRLLWAIGSSSVTRHDAIRSVRAGFRLGELSCLWPVRDDWATEEHGAGLFTHAFVARRMRTPA
jgi:SAM-dependent methyltransferase